MINTVNVPVNNEYSEHKKCYVNTDIGKIISTFFILLSPIIASCNSNSPSGNNNNTNDASIEQPAPGISLGLLGDKTIVISGNYPKEIFLEADVFYKNHNAAKAEADEIIKFHSVSEFFNFEKSAKEPVNRYCVVAARDDLMKDQIPIVKTSEEAKSNNGLRGTECFPPDGIDATW